MGPPGNMKENSQELFLGIFEQVPWNIAKSSWEPKFIYMAPNSRKEQFPGTSHGTWLFLHGIVRMFPQCSQESKPQVPGTCVQLGPALLDGFLDFLLWISLKITWIPLLRSEILKQLKFLIYFFLIAIDWLLIDFKDALLEWVGHVDPKLWRGLLSCDSSPHLLRSRKSWRRLNLNSWRFWRSCWWCWCPSLGWWSRWLRPEAWATWESDSADSCLTLFLLKQEFLNEIFEQHLIMWIFLIVNIWLMSSNLELLEFLNSEHLKGSTGGGFRNIKTTLIEGSYAQRQSSICHVFWQCWFIQFDLLDSKLQSLHDQYADAKQHCDHASSKIAFQFARAASWNLSRDGHRNLDKEGTVINTARMRPWDCPKNRVSGKSQKFLWFYLEFVRLNNLQKQNIATRDLQLQEPRDEEDIEQPQLFDLQSYDIVLQ